MGKFLVRITIVFIALYLVLSFIIAQFFFIDILGNWYIILFETCVVVYCFSEGKYHCEYLKFSALSLLVVDTLTRLDNTFNFLSVTAHNLIPIAILALGIGTSITLALRHFHKVNQLRNKRNKQWK